MLVRKPDINDSIDDLASLNIHLDLLILKSIQLLETKEAQDTGLRIGTNNDDQMMEAILEGVTPPALLNLLRVD